MPTGDAPARLTPSEKSPAFSRLWWRKPDKRFPWATASSPWAMTAGYTVTHCEVWFRNFATADSASVSLAGGFDASEFDWLDDGRRGTHRSRSVPRIIVGGAHGGDPPRARRG